MEANGGGHGAAAEEGENVNGQNGAGAGSAGATAGTATVPGNLAGAAGVTKRVTQQNGPRGEGALMDVLLWNESAVAKSMGCRLVVSNRLCELVLVTKRNIDWCHRGELVCSTGKLALLSLSGLW